MPNATNAQTDMDVVINIGDFSVSLYEGEQEILGKLDKMGLLYEKVEDSDKLDIENPIIRINTAFKGCSSLEKISVLPRIYHN